MDGLELTAGILDAIARGATIGLYVRDARPVWVNPSSVEVPLLYGPTNVFESLMRIKDPRFKTDSLKYIGGRSFKLYGAMGEDPTKLRDRCEMSFEADNIMSIVIGPAPQQQQQQQG